MKPENASTAMGLCPARRGIGPGWSKRRPGQAGSGDNRRSAAGALEPESVIPNCSHGRQLARATRFSSTFATTAGPGLAPRRVRVLEPSFRLRPSAHLRLDGVAMNARAFDDGLLPSDCRPHIYKE